MTPVQRDNTWSSMLVIALLAGGAVLVALLIGLSEKPDVTAFGVVATTDAPVANAALQVESTNAATTSIDVDNDGNAVVTEPLPTATATPIVIPTSTPIPQVAAAVPDTTDDAAALAAVGTLEVTTGTIVGEFLTRSDEEDGAEVTANEIGLQVNEDGTGQFIGVLAMNMPDGTVISLNMSGPFRWSNEPPQVEAMLVGQYAQDSPIDADDVQAEQGALQITSLTSGAGALCVPRCFGFQF